jgi:hypothetical protein
MGSRCDSEGANIRDQIDGVVIVRAANDALEQASLV